MTDKEIQASDEEMEQFNVLQNEKCVSAEEVKMIKAELNQLAAKDKYSNIYECTLRLINLYKEIILGNQIEILELEKENEELKKNALVWHKVTCFDKPDENGFITNDAPSVSGIIYFVKLKNGERELLELEECDGGVFFEDYEWEDVDAWAELSRV